jgi:hypothetical protein
VEIQDTHAPAAVQLAQDHQSLEALIVLTASAADSRARLCLWKPSCDAPAASQLRQGGRSQGCIPSHIQNNPYGGQAHSGHPIPSRQDEHGRTHLPPALIFSIRVLASSTPAPTLPCQSNRQHPHTWRSRQHKGPEGLASHPVGHQVGCMAAHFSVSALCQCLRCFCHWIIISVLQ